MKLVWIFTVLGIWLALKVLEMHGCPSVLGSVFYFCFSLCFYLGFNAIFIISLTTFYSKPNLYVHNAGKWIPTVHGSPCWEEAISSNTQELHISPLPKRLRCLPLSTINTTCLTLRWWTANARETQVNSS